MARKKELRKAEFKTFSNCFDQEDDTRGKWNAHFKNDHPITFELGCGKAAFIYEMAKRYPERNFVGVDLKPARLWKPAGDALREKIHNLAFLCIHLLSVDKYIAKDEADEIWITFPDPFPKNRQAKHRMINPPFLKMYHHLLKPESSLHFKTDNQDLFQYSLEVFVKEQNIHFQKLSFDLHQDPTIGDDTKIITDYERKFMEMGKKINYVQFTFKD
jgi:tRNA (guanine-N7-)-methyltransferase